MVFCHWHPGHSCLVTQHSHLSIYWFASGVAITNMAKFGFGTQGNANSFYRPPWLKDFESDSECSCFAKKVSAKNINGNLIQVFRQNLTWLTLMWWWLHGSHWNQMSSADNSCAKHIWLSSWLLESRDFPHSTINGIVHPKLKILLLFIHLMSFQSHRTFFSSMEHEVLKNRNSWPLSIIKVNEDWDCRTSKGTIKVSLKYHKSSPDELCTIFQVFWSHTIALCEKQTKSHYSPIILHFSRLLTVASELLRKWVNKSFRQILWTGSINDNFFGVFFSVSIEL